MADWREEVHGPTADAVLGDQPHGQGRPARRLSLHPLARAVGSSGSRVCPSGPGAEDAGRAVPDATQVAAAAVAMRFEGTPTYVATDDLKLAVDAARTGDQTAGSTPPAC